MMAIEFGKTRNRVSGTPVVSVDDKLARIQVLLEDLDKRLSFIERSRLLSLDPQEIFAIYTPFQMEERAIPIVTLFSRSSIILGIYRCELRALMNEYVGEGKPGLSEEQILRIGTLAAFITELREKHINTYGRNVCAAFNYRLVSPEEHTDAEPDTLEALLIRFFGSANLDGDNSLSLSRMKCLLDSFGSKTKCVLPAEKLSSAVDELAARPSETPPVSEDAGTWSEELKPLLLTLESKIAHLQKDLEEVLNELALGGNNRMDLQNASLTQIREKVSYLYQKFVRGDLLLKCYEAELRFALMEYDQAQLSEVMKSSVAAIRESIMIMQQVYIQKYALKIAFAIKRRLGVYNETSASARWLDKCLVYAFDMGIMQANDNKCPGLQETEEFVASLGKLLKLEDDAEALLDGIRSLEI